MPQRPASQSLTLTAAPGKRLRALISECFISEAFDPATTATRPVPKTFKSIWDTGASTSVITQKVVDECGLQSIGPAITLGVGGRHPTEAFLVNITLLNKVSFAGLRVIRGSITADIDVLIGMDIITQGDFSITNKNDTTIFSFRHPSMVAVDFVKEHNAELAKAALAQHGKRPLLPIRK